MKFRPCIDLHDGLVKQIVGSSLSDDRRSSVEVNFVAEKKPAWFAELYRGDNLTGGHIIKLGPGNDAAAKEALVAWPEGMQIGGAIDAHNAELWLECGASHIIVTSYVFKDGQIDIGRLQKLVRTVGKEKIVLDLSCRKKEDDYFIVTDRWQKFTDVSVTKEILTELSGYCDEFLIHAADVEGKCSGIEMDLVEKLGNWTPLPTTYAGGIRNFEDLILIQQQGQGRLDFTVGSALDIFGGTMSYDDTVQFCR